MALSRLKHGFESRWGRQTFLGPFIGLQAPEKRRGYGGSIESNSVERNPFRKEQLQPHGLSEAAWDQQPHGPRAHEAQQGEVSDQELAEVHRDARRVTR